MIITIFLYSDSLLAFKTCIIYSVGIYIFTLLKLIHSEPRPFWQT